MNAVSSKKVDWPHSILNIATGGLKPGELTTIISGPGDKGPLFVRQAVTAWLAADERVAYRCLNEGQVDFLIKHLAQIEACADMMRIDYIRAHADLMHELLRAHEDEITALSECLCTDDDVPAGKCDEIAEWANQQARSGARVIVIEPVYWPMTEKYAVQLQRVARDRDCSIVVVAVPRTLGGTDELSRFSHNVLSINSMDEDKEDLLFTCDGRPIDMFFNQVVTINKLRSGRAHITGEVAFLFDPETLRTMEVGLMLFPAQSCRFASSPRQAGQPVAAGYTTTDVKSKPAVGAAIEQPEHNH